MYPSRLYTNTQAHVETLRATRCWESMGGSCTPLVMENSGVQIPVPASSPTRGEVETLHHLTLTMVDATPLSTE